MRWLLVLTSISIARGVLAQPVPPPKPLVELRGVWLVAQDLTKSHAELSAMLDAFASANFNTIFVDVWYRGYTAYPDSAIAPQFPALHGEDTIGFLVEECHKRKLQIHFWIGYGFYAYFTPDARRDANTGPILEAHPELAAVDSQGNRFLHHKGLGDFYSMCPSNPASHALLARLMVEAITKYPVDGLHLDRIRYPDANFCYCDFCRKYFRKDMRRDLEAFDPRSDGAKQFLEWKRQQTLRAVRTFEREVHRTRPGLPITSYVLSPIEMNGKAQAWDLWMKEKLLSGVAVSMYEKDIRGTLDDALPLVGGDRSKLICAISAEGDKSGDVYLHNIDTARLYRTMGQITWFSDEVMDEIPALKAGQYHDAAPSPFEKPK